MYPGEGCVKRRVAVPVWDTAEMGTTYLCRQPCSTPLTPYSGDFAPELSSYPSPSVTTAAGPVGTGAEGPTMLYDGPVGETFDVQFEPTHAAASETRQLVGRRLDEAGIPAVIAADVELVIAELLSNAVEQEPSEPIRLEAAIADDAIYLSVSNRVTGGGATSVHLPTNGEDLPAPSGELAEDGRGLYIIRALTDRLWFEGDDDWTTVSCLRRFSPIDRPPG